jgi:hypothetical protein
MCTKQDGQVLAQTWRRSGGWRRRGCVPDAWMSHLAEADMAPPLPGIMNRHKEGLLVPMGYPKDGTRRRSANWVRSQSWGRDWTAPCHGGG